MINHDHSKPQFSKMKTFSNIFKLCLLLMSNLILLFDKIFMKTFLFLEDLVVNGFGHAQTES